MKSRKKCVGDAGNSPPEEGARPATHFRPHDETDSKLPEQAYAIPCGSATSSTRREQLESIAFAQEGASSRAFRLRFAFLQS
jgi:hypothetical protein